MEPGQGRVHQIGVVSFARSRTITSKTLFLSSALALTALIGSVPTVSEARERTRAEQRQYDTVRSGMGYIGQRVLRFRGAGAATKRAYDYGDRFQGWYPRTMRNVGRNTLGPYFNRRCESSSRTA